MGFTSALFGGGQGSGYSAQAAPLLATTNGTQINQDLAKSNAGIAQYQGFLNALQGQNGIQNQSNVYNQLQDVAAGKGPNPAQAQLANATGANVANQAALMASQRGVGANPGLIARQAANQGANIQQNAAGQAAALQANQSLNAINSAGNIATNQVGNLASGENSYNNLVQNQRAQTLGAAAAYNNAIASSTGSQNAANSNVAAKNAGTQGGLFASGIGGLASAGGSALTGIFGKAGPSPAGTANLPTGGPTESYGSGSTLSGGMGTTGSASDTGGGFTASNGASYADGGAVSDIAGTPAGGPQSATAQFLKSVGEQTATPPPVETEAPKMYRGGNVGSKLKTGGKVPGQAKVKGNSYENDTVSAKLSPGEVVIPRSVMQSNDPAKNAAAFVSAVMAKSGKMPRKS